jgi:hypothetical protein
MTPAAAAAEMKLAGAQKAARTVPVVSPAVEKPAALAPSPATAAPLAHQHALDDEPHQLKTQCRIFEEEDRARPASRGVSARLDHGAGDRRAPAMRECREPCS